MPRCRRREQRLQRRRLSRVTSNEKKNKKNRERKSERSIKTKVSLASELVSLQEHFELVVYPPCTNSNPPTFQARMQKSHLLVRQHRLSKKKKQKTTERCTRVISPSLKPAISILLDTNRSLKGRKKKARLSLPNWMRCSATAGAGGKVGRRLNTGALSAPPALTRIPRLCNCNEG